ncbi:hypothetical protein BH09BAC4_BH09BAC4_33720 [soil metagenome]
MANSLQNITDAWGNWMNAQLNGGGVKFTESTNYGAQSSLANYHQYQTSATYQSLNYDTSNYNPVSGSISSTVSSFNNNSSVQDSQAYAQSVTTTQQFAWSITESLQVGVQVSATEGVPSVASATEQVSVNLTLSSTQSETTTNSQSWSINTTINVPAESVVDATLVVTTNQYDIPWTATCLLSGSVAIWFNNKVDLNHNNDYHWLWFVDIGSVFADCINNNIIDTTGYQLVNGGVQAMASGTFSGSQGTSSNVNVVQKPLPPSNATTTTYSIPVSNNGSLLRMAA